MRRLVLVRIVHTSADMGSMGTGLKGRAMARVGRERWLENERKIDKFWDDTDKEIEGLGLDYARLKVYQDGLPAGGDLGKKIVDETAAKGSKNYLIVQKLMSRGATIEATESTPLLMKEYAYIKAIVSADTPEKQRSALEEYDRAKDALIKARDDHIAAAIDRTLKEGETGILFIGAAHDVLPRLPKDIEVKRLD
jgi:hypothetical protein